MLTFKVTFTSKDVLNLFLLAKCSSYVKYFWRRFKACGMFMCIYTCVYVYIHTIGKP